MDIYFDTSVIVPMIIRESHSSRALSLLKEADVLWAWRWLQVETEAAMNRRRARPESWQQWHRLARRIRWLDLEQGYYESLCAFNRSLGLRATDAGHLFVFDRTSRAIPTLILATFDDEMLVAAKRLGIVTRH